MKTGGSKGKKKIPIYKPVNLLRMHGNVKWHEACSEVYQLVKSEPGFDLHGEPVNFKPIPDRRTAYEDLVIKYINYVRSFQKLSDCYKWLVHPQKRALLKRCIEAVAGRICEIKLEMIDLDKSLFNYFDDILHDHQLTPDDLKLQSPPYMLAHRRKVLEMRDRLLTMMIERVHSVDNAGDNGETVVNSISSHQKGDAKYVTEGEEQILPEATYSTKIRSRPQPTCKSKEIKQDGVVSAFLQAIKDNYQTDDKIKKRVILIQRMCRIWLIRKRTKQNEDKEDIALGMMWPRNLVEVDAKDEADYNKREDMWLERDEELQISKTIEHERFMAAHGHNMAWTLKYNITQWLLELRDLQGSFPDYPTEEEGGCERLFAMKTTSEVEAEIIEMLNPTPTAPVKEDKKVQAKKVEVEIEGWKPRPTETIPKLIDVLAEYNNYWYLKDDMDNVEQKFDRQTMLEQVRDESSKQIRLQVDDLMRYELDKLRCGIEFIEMAERPKINKDANNQEKDKVTKDPLALKTVEELYGELVLQGIVTPVQNIAMEDVLGDNNFVTTAQQECIPTLADIKTMLTHLVVLPLNSEFIHSVVPLTNRMLFAGPSGTGKTMILHALCRETGANLFDISPEVLAGKYEGPQQQEYLMNALLKVGKSMEPTIFYIDDCNSLYMKPPPGSQVNQDRPQRWVSVFYKMMDKMKKGDRMFLIGESTEPFMCNNQAMFDLFKFSEGYSGQEIENAVNETLTSKRLNSMKPLTNMDFIVTLNLDQNSTPLDESDVTDWTTWYWTTPHLKKRKLMLDREEEVRNLTQV